jgi:hypothetical protein
MKVHTLLFAITTAVVCIVLLVLVAPARSEPRLAAQPAVADFFGMNTYFTGLERINNDGDDGTTTLMSLGRAVGTQWGREEMVWFNFERHHNDWADTTFNNYDPKILEMAEAEYGIVGIIVTTPDWAKVSDCAERTQAYASYNVFAPQYMCPPASIEDFSGFVGRLVERYDGDGMNDAPGSPRIAVWQIWNEPNHWETWPGTAAEYAQLLKQGYAAAKAADPTTIVATAGLYVFDGESPNAGECECHKDGLYFFNQVLEADPTVWSSFDVLAIHPYMPFDAPDSPNLVSKVTLWGRIQTASDWLAANTAARGGPERPIWISEIGWIAPQQGLLADQRESLARYRIPPDYRSGGAATLAESVTEEEQAIYLVRAHVIARALGVQHMSYLQLEDKFDEHDRDIWQGSAILRTKASNYEPKPAYRAYQAMISQLGGALYTGQGTLHTYTYDPQEDHNPAARYHFRFQKTPYLLVDVLWHSSETQQVALPVEPEAQQVMLVAREGATTLLNPQQGEVTFQVSESPVYILQALPMPTPTPTATPTPTPTATPIATMTPTPTPTPPPGDDYEPDNVCGAASLISQDGHVQRHTFHLPGDTDWSHFDAFSATTYLVEARVPAGSPARVALSLSDSCTASTLRVVSQQDNLPHAWLRHTTPTTSTTLRIEATSEETTTTGVTTTWDLAVRSLPVSATDGLVIAAGQLDEESPLQQNINRAASQVEQLFQEQGYPAERILSTDQLTATEPLSPTQPISATEVVSTTDPLTPTDGLTTTRVLETAIVTWTARNVGQGGMLTLYIVGSGGVDTEGEGYIYLDKPAGQRIEAGLLGGWLDELAKDRPDIKINVILEASFSGSFVETLSQPGRMIITSSSASYPAWAGVHSALFTDYFVAALRQGSSFYGAFQAARDAVEEVDPRQTPLLDDNGDGAATTTGDGSEAQQRGILMASATITTTLPPYIVELSMPLSDTIEAEVQAQSGAAVGHVRGYVYPPRYQAEVDDGELAQHDSPVALLPFAASGEGGNYQARYTDVVTTSGTHRLVVYASDNRGLEAWPVAVEVQQPPTPTSTPTPIPTSSPTPTTTATEGMLLYLPLVSYSTMSGR